MRCGPQRQDHIPPAYRPDSGNHLYNRTIPIGGGTKLRLSDEDYVFWDPNQATTAVAWMIRKT